MSYIVFARKYRPKDFDEIIGQDHITTTLKNAIKQDRVAHAYLFSGPRGIGKTTTARILAKSLNCETGPTPTPCNKCISCTEISSSISMDVIEIDGASNRGIDEVRELRENVKFAPTHGRYKLYIIDEVHMLTQEAFNALLKTLEEPPSHVKFIFATTQAHKVIPTVSSRCQRFDFRRISIADIVSKLKEIAKDESIKVDEETLFLIARQADGSLRDGESILDQLNAFCSGDIKKEDIAHILGTVSEESLEDFAQIIIKRDTPEALKFIDKLISEGKDLTFFLLNLISHFRNLMVAKLCTKPEGLIDSSRQTIEKIANQSKAFSQEELFYISSILTHTYESMKRSASARVIFELAIVKITERASLTSLNDILDKIRALETRIGKGIPSPPREEGKDKKVEERAPLVSPEERVSNVKDELEVEEAASEANDIELSKIEEAWPTLLKIIKTKKMSVASYLLEGSIIAFEDSTLTIGFPENYSLHKEALEHKDNRHLIEKTLKEILKKDVRVKLTTQNIRKEKAADYAGEDTRRKSKPVESEILKEPLVQSALEVFDGRIIRRNQK